MWAKLFRWRQREISVGAVTGNSKPSSAFMFQRKGCGTVHSSLSFGKKRTNLNTYWWLLIMSIELLTIYWQTNNYYILYHCRLKVFPLATEHSNIISKLQNIIKVVQRKLRFTSCLCFAPFDLSFSFSLSTSVYIFFACWLSMSYLLAILK